MEHNVKESKTSALMYIIYGLESIPAAFGLLAALVYLNESLFASLWFLISAILISPLPLIVQNKTKIVKSKVLMIALQVFVSFIVFCIGIAIIPSAPKEPEPEITRTILESETADTPEYETVTLSTVLAETPAQTETDTVITTETTQESSDTSYTTTEAATTEDPTTEATTTVEPTTLPPTTEPPTPPPTVPPTLPPTERITEPPAPPRQASHSFVLNTNTMKFHYPTCSSVKDIAPENYATYEGTADEVIQKGYQPCKRCSPH